MGTNRLTTWGKHVKQAVGPSGEGADLLVACSRCALRIPIDQIGAEQSSEHAIIAEGDGLYYGWAKSGASQIWLAARRALVSNEHPTESERGVILELTKTASNPAVAGERPLRDLHGIAYHRDRLWIACSYDDAVAIYNPATEEWLWWQPLQRAEHAGPDQFHFNTLMIEQDRVWVLAHRRGPSWLLAFPVEAALSGQTVKPLQSVELGHQAHNIWRQDSGELSTCSSIEGALLGEHGWRLNTGGFPRGVARTAHGWVVGISELKERSARDFSDARLKFYDRSWQQVGELSLPRVGMVLDLMLVPRTTVLPCVGNLPAAAD